MVFARLFLVLFFSLGLATPAHAQGEVRRDLHAGDWLRARTHTGERTTGTLVMLQDDRLRLKAARGPETDVPLANLERLEVSVGRNRGRSALIGAGAGLVGGFLIGALISSQTGGGGEGANLAVIGVPLFAVPAGALLGAASAPHRFVIVARPYRMVGGGNTGP